MDNMTNTAAAFRGRVFDPGFLTYLKDQIKTKASGFYNYETGEIVNKPDSLSESDPFPENSKPGPGDLPFLRGKDMMKLHEEWLEKNQAQNPYAGPDGKADFTAMEAFIKDSRKLARYSLDQPEGAWNRDDGTTSVSPPFIGEKEVSIKDIEKALKDWEI